MKTKALIFGIFGLLALAGWPAVLTVQAQTQTPDPATTSSAELRQAIRDRIEETLKDKTVNQPNFSGYLGTITQIGPATFSLMSIQGEEKTVQVSEETTLLSGTRTISLQDLVVGNGITVMGLR